MKRILIFCVIICFIPLFANAQFNINWKKMKHEIFLGLGFSSLIEETVDKCFEKKNYFDLNNKKYQTNWFRKNNEVTLRKGCVGNKIISKKNETSKKTHRNKIRFNHNISRPKLIYSIKYPSVCDPYNFKSSGKCYKKIDIIDNNISISINGFELNYYRTKPIGNNVRPGYMNKGLFGSDMFKDVFLFDVEQKDKTPIANKKQRVGSKI